MIESFKRYGFKQPIKYEPALNSGNGGIVAGNGRVEALATMRRLGEKPPIGIKVENGDWLVPVIYGVFSEKESEAQSYGIDDNNLTLMGGEFMPLDISRMWEQDSYLDILNELTHTKLPISVDGASLDVIKEFLGMEEQKLTEKPKGNGKVVCPECGAEFIPRK